MKRFLCLSLLVILSGFLWSPPANFISADFGNIESVTAFSKAPGNVNNNLNSSGNLNTNGLPQLIVSRDAGTPDSHYITPSDNGISAFRLKLSTAGKNIRVTDIYLVTVDPANGRQVDLDSSVKKYELVWPGGSTRAQSSKGVIHFAIRGDNTLLINNNSSVLATVRLFPASIDGVSDTGRQIKIATVPDVVGGVTGADFLPGTAKGIRAVSLNPLSLLPALSLSVSGSSNPLILVNSRAIFSRVQPAFSTLFPGQHVELYRFSVVNQGPGNFDLGKISFDLALTQTRLHDVTLYDLDNISSPLNTIRPTLSESGRISLVIDANAPYTGAQTFAGNTKTYILVADVSFSGIGTHTSGVRIAGESCPHSVGTFQTLQHNCLLVWSDESADNHGLSVPASRDWMGGTYFSELPTNYTVMTAFD